MYPQRLWMDAQPRASDGEKITLVATDRLRETFVIGSSDRLVNAAAAKAENPRSTT